MEATTIPKILSSISSPIVAAHKAALTKTAHNQVAIKSPLPSFGGVPSGGGRYGVGIFGYVVFRLDLAAT